jgi:hypothetical protein
LLLKDGNRLAFTTNDGEIVKYYRKEWERNEDGCLDTVMKEYKINPHRIKNSEIVEET